VADRDEDADVDAMLVVLSCSRKSPTKLTFEYLADIDPQALKVYVKEGQFNSLPKPWIHCIIGTGFIEAVQLFLTTTLKYYPADLGVLFLKIKQNHNKTAFKVAAEKGGPIGASSIH